MHSKTKIIKAKDKDHLKSLIKREIEQQGPNCSLNHIDVSEIKDMSFLFGSSKFNGDIGQWNTSMVTDMRMMFSESSFNGDISQWNTEKVTNMSGVFYQSSFNSDISQWNTSNVNTIDWMFEESEFKGDLRPWHLTEKQMTKAFQESLLNYLAIRQSIEEAEKLHAAFGNNTARIKKAL